MNKYCLSNQIILKYLDKLKRHSFSIPIQVPFNFERIDNFSELVSLYEYRQIKIEPALFFSHVGVCTFFLFRFYRHSIERKCNIAADHAQLKPPLENPIFCEFPFASLISFITLELGLDWLIRT